MTTVANDARGVADQLVLTGLTWCGTLPPEYDGTGVRGRLEGAEFSILTMIDGASLNIDPVRLSPKNNLDVDLGDQALHERYENRAALDNDEQRQFVARLRQLVDKHTEQPGTATSAMGAFLLDVCRMLGEHYELRLLDVDDDGEVLAERGDVAPALASEFADVWDRAH